MRICLFDIDGTLVSSGGAGKAAMEAALASAFGAAADAGEVPFAGRTDRAIARDLFAFHRIDDSLKSWRRFVQEYIGHLPDQLFQKPGKVMPGVGELLGELDQMDDVLVGLLTGNVRDGARLKLGHFGINDYFRCGGFGDTHLDRNEVARDALSNAQRHLGGPVAKNQVWIIGDTPLDVQCARAIGAHVAAVATGWHPIEELADSHPDLLLPDLADPAPLLEKLAS